MKTKVLKGIKHVLYGTTQDMDVAKLVVKACLNNGAQSAVITRFLWFKPKIWVNPDWMKGGIWVNEEPRRKEPKGV